jgi:hypothetical protein
MISTHDGGHFARVKLFLSVWPKRMDGRYVESVTAQPQICNKKDTSSVETTRCGTVTHTMCTWPTHHSMHCTPKLWTLLTWSSGGRAQRSCQAARVHRSSVPHGKRILFLDDDISDIDLGLSHSEYGVHSVCRCSCRVSSV